MRQALFPNDHPDVAASLMSVGLAYDHQGNYQEALKYKWRDLLCDRSYSLTIILMLQGPSVMWHWRMVGLERTSRRSSSTSKPFI